MTVCTGPLFGKRQKIPENSQAVSLHSILSILIDRSCATHADEISSAKLCKNCKFCMKFVALIAFINYYAQSPFKRDQKHGESRLRACQHERTGSRGARRSRTSKN